MPDDRTRVRVPFTLWNKSGYRSSCWKVGATSSALFRRQRLGPVSKRCAPRDSTQSASPIGSTWMGSSPRAAGVAGMARPSPDMKIRPGGPRTCVTTAGPSAPGDTVTRPYAEREHRSAVAALKRHPVACACGRPATTIGHVPALVMHAHRAGSGCCRKVPQCGPCNYGEGARIANRRRRARGLAPGSGWLL